MSIIYQDLPDVKTVIKPWGQEKWIQKGNIFHPYVLKEITLNPNQRTSLQVHKTKSETLYIIEGNGKLVYNDKFFDCEMYLSGKYTDLEVSNFLTTLKEVNLTSGCVITIDPGSIHRMVADTTLRFVEASTCELDDVIRLQDDSNRTHGKINSEHK